MEKFAKKGMAALVGLALVSAAGLAQAATRFAVQNGSAVDQMVVTDTGYIGVGTASPISGIHAKGSTIPITQIGTQYTGPEPTGGGGFVAFRNQVPTTNGGLPIAGNRLGYILFGGYDGTTPRYSAGFFAYAEQAWSRTSTPSYYTFETTAAGKVTRDEWMRITSSGNVGIGTPSPRANLEVNGGLRLIAAPTLATTTSPARTAPARPACDDTNGPNIRGTFWFNQGDEGVADTVTVCAKDGNGNYSWVSLN